MFTEIPLLTRCCFCAPLRRGLLTWAYFKLVFNILVFGCGLIVLSTVGGFLFFCDSVIYILTLVWSVLILFFFDIIFNFVLIVGCHKKHTTLLRLYYRFGIAHAVFFLTLGFIVIAFMLYIVIRHNDNSELWDFILVLSFICCMLLILHMYLLLLVRSEILQLKPSSHIQFVNHIADPKCVMQVDFLSKHISTEIFSEKPLP